MDDRGPDKTTAIDQFDEWVEALFDHGRGVPAIDRLMYTLSELADFSVLWHLLGTAQGLVLPRGVERALRLSVTLGLESALVNGAMKSLFRRQRPTVAATRPFELRVPRTTSFPSGHASAAFVAAALLSDGVAHRRAYYTLATMVALSRIHVRIHHASDVAGGVATGIALGALAKKLWPLERRWRVQLS